MARCDRYPCVFLLFLKMSCSILWKLRLISYNSRLACLVPFHFNFARPSQGITSLQCSHSALFAMLCAHTVLSSQSTAINHLIIASLDISLIQCSPWSGQNKIRKQKSVTAFVSVVCVCVYIMYTGLGSISISLRSRCFFL